MRNCASGNLEIPGLVLSLHPGMTEQDKPGHDGEFSRRNPVDSCPVL